MFASSGVAHFMVLSSCSKPGQAVRVVTAPALDASSIFRSDTLVANGLLELKIHDESLRPQTVAAVVGSTGVTSSPPAPELRGVINLERRLLMPSSIFSSDLVGWWLGGDEREAVDEDEPPGMLMCRPP